VDSADDLRREWFDECAAVGVTAGASAPEVLVRQVVERLAQWGGEMPEELVGREEHIVFTLPKVLRTA
jgi:4-hydroxy-3-methylbut-2-en-1-yl diphosphate reductase